MRYIEFGGGLGDIIHQCFEDGGYRSLERLGPHERVKVALITHNPAAVTLFDHHPFRTQLEIVAPGYWLPEDDEIQRSRLGLPRYTGTPVDHSVPVRFYPRAEAKALIDSLAAERPLVVLSPCAGETCRDVPLTDMQGILRRMPPGVLPVQVGMDYQRNDRPPEMRYARHARGPFIDLVGRLGVADTLYLVSRSAAVVTAHSAVNMMAWHLRVRQLLLYPPHVKERHFTRPDQWSFGAWSSPLADLTHHGLFGDERPVDAFFQHLQGDLTGVRTLTE